MTSQEGNKQRKADGGSVESLAGAALRTLASRRQGTRGLSEQHLRALQAAVVGTDPAARNRVVEMMRDDDIPLLDICDLYIPAVARRLGEMWCEDEMSFATVTIGTARLQSMLRELGETVDPPADAGGSLVVMVLAEEFHTLGAMVLTGQLRRLGATVQLVLGRPAEEVERIVRDGDFDAVLISISNRDEFEDTARIVRTLRRTTGGGVPLIVGGSAVESGTEVVKEATGADHVTSDLHEALRLSGYDFERGSGT